MTPFVVAHLGHWYVSMLYVAPVLVVVGALWLQTRRERRDGNADRDCED